MAVQTGKISWFNDTTTATGISAATTKGIAVANSATLGGYWLLKQGSNLVVVQQIDFGPAGWTGRLFDFSAPLQAALGNPATDSSASGVYLGKTVTDVAHNLGSAVSQLGAGAGTPGSGGLHAVDMTPNGIAKQALNAIGKGVISSSTPTFGVAGVGPQAPAGTVPAGTTVSGPGTAPLGLDLSGLTAIANLLTSTDFWRRFGEAIAGIVLIAMGLRSLTGSTTSPADVAGAALKVAR